MTSKKERVLLNKIEEAKIRNRIWHRIVVGWVVATSAGVGGLSTSGGFYILAWILLIITIISGAITVCVLANDVVDNHGEWPGKRLRDARQAYTDYLIDRQESDAPVIPMPRAQTYKEPRPRRMRRVDSEGTE